jgi:hypothetical protein
MIVDFEAEVTYSQERELLTKFVKLNAKVGVHRSHVRRMAFVVRRAGHLMSSSR